MIKYSIPGIIQEMGSKGKRRKKKPIKEWLGGMRKSMDSKDHTAEDGKKT